VIKPQILNTFKVNLPIFIELQRNVFDKCENGWKATFIGYLHKMTRYAVVDLLCRVCKS